MLSITEVVVKLVVDTWMSMEHQGNNTDGKTKVLREKLSLCPFVHHRSHIDLAGIELGLLQCETGDCLNGLKGFC
jgi:hypothetical protein